MNISKKLLSLLLILSILLSNGPVAVGVVYAQESTSEPASEPLQTQQESQSESPSPASTVIPPTEPSSSPQPGSSLGEVPTPTASPTPAPTMTPDEYDAWKVQKNLEDDLRELREDEWEAHEEDQEWIAAHGGDEEYYTSGRWQRDEDARRAREAEEAAAAAAAAHSQDSAQGLGDSPESALRSGENGGQCRTQDQLAVDSEDSLNTAAGEGEGSAVSQSSREVAISTDNCLDLQNNSYAAGVSGKNSQLGNDGSVAMTTGSSSASGTLVNQGNQNFVDVDDFGTASASTNDSFAQGSEAENLSTGKDSENLAVASEANSLTVDNSNQAYVDNNMTVDAVSGVNEVSNNDGSATLTTGDIELIANMLNILNINVTGDDFLHLIVNIFGALTGDLDLDDIAIKLGFSDEDDLEVIARNEDTGEGSQNTAEATRETNTEVNNSNYAEVSNEMNVNGVSGQNNVSGNDGTANVITGRIKILANLMNFINANFSGEKWSFIMVNIFGSLTGDIIVPETGAYLDNAGSAVASNTNPGEGSINKQTVVSQENTSVTNTNGVDLTNNVKANGISGENNQIGNDDEGHSVDTGRVDVATQLLNYLNFNITGNNWVFLIVNVFGKWMGKIVGFGDEAMDVVGGSFAALKVGGTGEGDAQALNTNTGEGSINEANAQNLANTNVTNDNYAKVNNDMNINGISGQNDVNKNDGSTSITTGWVEIDANLLNIINMNVTGRSWMIVFLNIFGDFAGNLFFGQAEADAYRAALAASQEQVEKAVGGVAANAQEVISVSGTRIESNASAQAEDGGSAEALVEMTLTQNGRTIPRTAKQVVLGSSPADEEGSEQISSYQAEFEPLPEPEELTFFERIRRILSDFFKKVADIVLVFSAQPVRALGDLPLAALAKSL